MCIICARTIKFIVAIVEIHTEAPSPGMWYGKLSKWFREMAVALISPPRTFSSARNSKVATKESAIAS